jgi:hypothetical protein
LKIFFLVVVHRWQSHFCLINPQYREVCGVLHCLCCKQWALRPANC